MNWMIEEARLGDEQKEIIEIAGTAQGTPVWIQGHAGSGKSVVLLHAVRDYLIRNPGANVAIVVFTWSLVDMVKTGLNQIPSLAGKFIPVLTIYQLDNRLNAGNQFDAIFCDEVQDLPIELIEKMKNSSNQLILAGDAAQSIFTILPKWGTSPASTSQINQKLNPITRRSSVIYRLTKSVITVLRNVFNEILGDLTWEGRDDSIIRLVQFSAEEGFKAEVEYTWGEMKLNNTINPNEVEAILIFKKEDIISYCQKVLEIENKPLWPENTIDHFGRIIPDLNNLNNHLASNNIPLIYVGNRIGSLSFADRQNKIILMTYHSAKGLDFDAVCLPFLSTSLIASPERKALMLVALSRAKKDLLISYNGDMFFGFEEFLKDIEPKRINDNNDDEVLF